MSPFPEARMHPAVELTVAGGHLDDVGARHRRTDEFVQRDARDGCILVPHLTPGGLYRFVAEVVPELRDRGSYRTEHPGPTLRGHLGLRHPHAPLTRRESA